MVAGVHKGGGMMRVGKAREAEAWEGFLERVRRAELQDEDRKRLAEVERVALGTAEHSRILGAFDVAETPETAHKFLLRCGYWAAEENPWPRRSGLPLDEVESRVRRGEIDHALVLDALYLFRLHEARS